MVELLRYAAEVKMNKEDILFNMLKDTNKTSNDFKRGILTKKYPGINFSELHRRIVNYQVKKYGRSLEENVVKESDIIRRKRK